MHVPIWIIAPCNHYLWNCVIEDKTIFPEFDGSIKEICQATSHNVYIHACTHRQFIIIRKKTKKQRRWLSLWLYSPQHKFTAILCEKYGRWSAFIVFQANLLSSTANNWLWNTLHLLIKWISTHCKQIMLHT